MAGTAPQIRDRRELVGDAAIEVLEAEGGRGLTHRAVDRQAGIPQGSTSNYYPTREALLSAALHRLVVLERPLVDALEALMPAGPYGPREAAGLVAGMVSEMIAPDRAGLSVARFELVLEARRRPGFQLDLDQVRREYLRTVEELLPAAGCGQPERHAPHLLAIIDGLIFNQVFGSATRFDDQTIAEHLRRFFEAC